MSGYASGSPDTAEAARIGEELDNPDMLVMIRNEQVLGAMARGEYEEALEWVDRAHEAGERVADPDLAADVPAIAAAPSLVLGRFDDARRHVARHAEIASQLTPHHRLHGVAYIAEVEELAGSWETVAELEPLVKERVNANLATPCIRNCRSLLLCAIAAEVAGERERAEALERQGREVALAGYGGALSGPELRLALVRRDRELLAELVDRGVGLGAGAGMFRLSAIGARLDALAELGRKADVELEAAPYFRPGTLHQPFALRALGRVREDEELIRQALDCFEAMGMEWHAAETRALLSGGA
jgi:hypothetical protein